MFVTIFCAVFDLNAGTVAYASAGHPSPVLLRPGEPPALPFGSTGMMAGLFPEMPLDGAPLDVRTGDTIVLYTDGVTEAFDEAGGAFGERGLLAELTAAPGGDPAGAVANVLGAVKRHAGQGPPSDDITVLAVRLTADFGGSQ